jgi:hypothetical protein
MVSLPSSFAGVFLGHVRERMSLTGAHICTKVLETEAKPDGVALNEWVDCRPVPEIDS